MIRNLILLRLACYVVCPRFEFLSVFFNFVANTFVSLSLSLSISHVMSHDGIADGCQVRLSGHNARKTKACCRDVRRTSRSLL